MNELHLDVPIIAILRGVETEFFADLMAASFAAGLQVLEVTMNTAGAEKIIEKNRPAVPSGSLLGMGTICNLEEAKRAVGVGAMFLVTPNTDPEVIEYGRAQDIPVIAGALTPSEVYRAWALGASMVKIFPCGAMGGPQYIKDLRGPFASIPMVAVGGVDLASLDSYFLAGVNAVGVGASFFGKQALLDKNINELTKNVKNYIESCLRFISFEHQVDNC